MKLVGLIRMHSNKICNKAHMGKYLPHAFHAGLKQGDPLLTFFFSFTLKYAIRKVQ